ncbi:MAG: hypothetical protein ACOC0O_04180 [Spirochaetota bacterium]
MIETATSVRLMLGLIVLVYGFLIAWSRHVTLRAGVVAAAGALPLVAWVLAPDLLGTGAFDLAINVRRAALIAGAAAIGLRYASFRTEGRSPAARAALDAASLVLLLASLAVGSANWLAAAPVVLSALAVWSLSPSEGSDDEARRGHPR